MPPLANLRHERFAQEYAAGRTQLDAYHRAGYSGANRANPSQMSKRPDIRARVEELKADRRVVDETMRLGRAEAVAGTFSDVKKITPEWLQAELLHNIDLARAANNIPAANKALEMLARMHGLSLSDDAKALGKKGKEPNRSDNDDSDRRTQIAVQVFNQGPVSADGGGGNGATPGARVIVDGREASLPTMPDGQSGDPTERVAALARFFGERVPDIVEAEREAESVLLHGMDDA